MTEVIQPIPARLKNVAVGGHVAGAEDIIDDALQKDQATINQEVQEAIGTGGSVDSRIAAAKSEIIGDAGSEYNTLGKLEDKIQAETAARQSADTALGNRITPLEQAVGTGGSVDSRISAAINALDASVSKSAGADGLALSVIEENGKVTAINGSIASNTYDAYGSASAAQSAAISAAATDATTKVNAAKAEIKGNATSACDTLGEAEALISAEASRAQAAETSLSSGKADKATTLSGYGITDAYTKSETYTKTEVNGLVDTPHQEYVTVADYASLPASGSKDTIYRVSNYNGSTSQVDASVYSEYAWDGSQYVFLCVKSQIGEVFDISVYNNNAKYSDLADALGTGGEHVPQSLRKGGMSVKFVQSSDNKYVQYRLMSDTFNTIVANWQEYGAEYRTDDIRIDIPFDGDGIGCYTGPSLNISTAENLSNWMHYHLSDITDYQGKIIRLRAGHKNNMTMLCYFKTSDNTVIAVTKYKQQDNFVLVVVPNNATDLYLSWCWNSYTEGAVDYIKVTPSAAFEPLDSEQSDSFTCGIISKDKRYLDCLLALSFSLPSDVRDHLFVMHLFGYSNDYHAMYFGIFDLTDNVFVGYAYKEASSMPSGIQQYHLPLRKNKNWHHTLEDIYIDVLIDWSKYDISMFLNTEGNSPIYVQFRGKQDYKYLIAKTVDSTDYFDFVNNINYEQYYKVENGAIVLAPSSSVGYCAKSFDAVAYRNKILCCSIGDVLHFCFFVLDDDSIVSFTVQELFTSSIGVFVVVPENAVTMYVSYNSSAKVFISYSPSYEQIAEDFIRKGYVSESEKYNKVLLNVGYSFSPKTKNTFKFKVIYFGLNPDNHRFYFGIQDLFNNKRAGYFISTESYETIPSSGIGVFHADVLFGHETGAFTLSDMTVMIDWSNYTEDMYFDDDTGVRPDIILNTFSSSHLLAWLNDRIANIENFSDAYTITEDSCPVLPSQIFLQSDKSMPLYKNSLFPDPFKASRVDIGLLANKTSNFKRRVFNIQEPTYFCDTDLGETGKFFLQRIDDMTHLYYKNVKFFHKDVSTVSGKTVKILSLGDSLTQGRNWNDTPVTMLAQDLAAYGVTVQYIGTLQRTYTDNNNNPVTFRYEGRGAWRYRTFVGLESMFAGLNVVIPDLNRSVWIEGTDGTMDEIKANNAWLYPATAQDLQDNPDFCFHFVSGSTVYNKSYSEDATLGTYYIFDPVRYFSERNIDIPDIVTIALGTNEWYLNEYGGFDNAKATACAEFMFKQFRKVSATMKIIVIPMNNFPMTRQDDWEDAFIRLCSNVMRVCDALIANGDNNLFVCPIYAQGSRELGFNGTVGSASNMSSINDVQKIEMDNNVHMLYEDDESNWDYRESLLACILNVIE